MADTRTLTTVATPVTAGGVHTRSLAVSAGIPVADALSDASCNLAAAIDAWFGIAMNSGLPGDSIWAAITSAATAKALIDSVCTAIERAEFAEREADHD